MKRTSTSSTPQAADTNPFLEPFHSVCESAAVLEALADAKAGADPENAVFWRGLCRLAEGIRSNALTLADVTDYGAAAAIGRGDEVVSL